VLFGFGSDRLNFWFRKPRKIYPMVCTKGLTIRFSRHPLCY